MTLINTGIECERVRVFLSKMDDNSLRYDEVAAKPLYAPFKRAVRKGKMRIEYTCLFDSPQHYRDRKGWTMLDRHSEFAYSVRKVFLNDLRSQPLQTEKTIVLLENRRWAITHGWSEDGIMEHPMLLVRRDAFESLRRQYMCIRSHSYAYRGRRTEAK